MLNITFTLAAGPYARGVLIGVFFIGRTAKTALEDVLRALAVGLVVPNHLPGVRVDVVAFVLLGIYFTPVSRSEASGSAAV